MGHEVPEPYDAVEEAAGPSIARTAAAAIDENLPAVLRRGTVHRALTGRWLGHALHPPLTDVPIGAWVSATVLDLTGDGRFDAASRRLIGVGLLASVPTVASGLAEWEETPSRDRPTAVLHAWSNGAATLAYLVSYVARTRGRTGLGKVAALVGGAAAGTGAYLGGHLAMGRGVGSGPRRFREAQQPTEHVPTAGPGR